MIDARALALKLARQISVTGTKGESDFADWLEDELKGFDEVWTSPIPGGAYPRKNLFALKRGKSKNTIVLTGHFDVVPADDYGALPAFDPEALLPLTIKKLKASGENPKALADFQSGDFLPGRGLLDMKAGLAAGIAAISAYKGDATLLFLAVADEENRSAGARAAVPVLKAVAARDELKIKLVINLDSIADQDDGEKAKVATFGSIGKQLLTALVVGKETHAGYQQNGINAAYIAAELVSEIEGNKDLAEETDGEIAAAPATLFAKDLKQGYNVTTPAQAFVYWNTLQHRRTAAEVFEIAQFLSARALQRVEEKTGWHVNLMTFEELTKLAKPDIKQVDDTVPLPEQSLAATQAFWNASGLTEPTVVLGFGSIPYQAVSLSSDALRRRITVALQPLGVATLNYFAGISDMSFFGEAHAALSVEHANTPVWGTAFEVPEAAGFPTINLGPWGRDYHHWLERLHAPYAFETLPRAILAVIEAVA